MAQSPQNNAITATPQVQPSTTSTKIGEINDIILDASGRVSNVVLGGFLGTGEHNVAVAFDQLEFVTEPAKTASNDDTGKTGNTNSVTTRGSTSTSSKQSDKWYPDHVVLNANKDQLKRMPEF